MSHGPVEWLAVGEEEVPVDNEWLTPRERAWLDRMRFPKRRLEYRLARWGAKAAIAGVATGDCHHVVTTRAPRPTNAITRKAARGQKNKSVLGRKDCVSRSCVFNASNRS